jgi:hypothetical protein
VRSQCSAGESLERLEASAPTGAAAPAEWPSPPMMMVLPVNWIERVGWPALIAIAVGDPPRISAATQ